MGSGIKKYRIFLFFALLLLASCRSGWKLSGNLSDEDREQKALAKEFKKLEKKAARRHEKEIWRAEQRALKEQSKSGKVAVRTKTKTKTKRSRTARRNVDKRIEKVISTARSYRGTPYRFGGTTRIGIDCSGLLCQSFSAIDVALPRNSYDQSNFGPTVRERDLQPGDLVFFGASKGSNTITHVGMVTEVNKLEEDVQFIHSSTRLGVIEDNLYGNYWRHLFIKAIRPKI